MIICAIRCDGRRDDVMILLELKSHGNGDMAT